jgi:hypothetical protein
MLAKRAVAYWVEFYNGTDDWKIIDMTIRIFDKKSGNYKDYDTDTTSVMPRHKGSLEFFPYEFPKNYEWGISRVRGYKITGQ